jgi:hypothetical protein
MPVQRLEANLGAYLKEHPQDPEGHYVLGRVYAFAFAADTNALDAREPEASGRSPFPWVNRFSRQALGKYEYKLLEKQGLWPFQLVPDTDTTLKYLSDGIRCLQKAIELDPQAARFHLTLGFLLERSRHLAASVDAGALLVFPPQPVEPELARQLIVAVHDLLDKDFAKAAAAQKLLEEDLESGISILSRYRIRSDPQAQQKITALLRRYWVRRCVEEYKRAFDLAHESDLVLAGGRMHGSLISFDAGQSLARLRKEEPDPFPLDAEVLAAVAEGVAKIDSIEAHYPVSPIILPSATGQGIGELCDRGKRVCFDLDGDGVVEDCSWVRPTTGILVWDSERSGRVESGRDLFGNATWWLLFSDGYRALDALDDDRDGWLSGAELAQLSVWYDLDSDGRAGPGEVIPIERTEIVGLATHWDAHEGTALRATHGMRLRGGAVLPTYDWYADCVR